MKLRLIAVILGALLLSVPVWAQMEAAEAPEARMAYYSCEWGLLVVEQLTEQPETFITIDSPEAYSAVEGTRFTLSGTGRALPEGNVAVDIIANGEIVFSRATVLQADEPGGEGDWSLEVDLGEIDSATPVYITAFATSPADGSTLAADDININVNSEFGMRFVDIIRPVFRDAVNVSPLLVEGEAGAAFENNIVIQAVSRETGDVLAETFATIETEELAGRGPFSAELMLELEPGTEFDVLAFHPPIADGEEMSVFDVEFVVANPLARSYDRMLYITATDPIMSSELYCTAAGLEFENEAIMPLTINDVMAVMTASMRPLVNVSIEAAGPSMCPAPLRTRVVRDVDTFNVDFYFDMSEQVACTMDLAPISQDFSLGTLDSPDVSIIVNGVSAE